MEDAGGISVTEIEICLSCEKAECDNCMSGKAVQEVTTETRVPRAVRRQQVARLISLGFSSSQIAKELNIDRSTARYWLKKMRCTNGQDV